MTNTIRVLSIDGGGIRAMIPCILLEYIERQTGKPTAELFDLIAGTSSGGIVALGLVTPGTPFTAADLTRLFVDNGAKIFSGRFGRIRQALDEKHPHAPLEGVLQRYFGEAKMNEATKPVLVPSYDVHGARPRFFKSRKPADAEVYMWQAARATTAAPTFFEAFKLKVDGRTEALIDGGMIANNPAMCALAEITHHREDYMLERFDDRVLVASLGTGHLLSSYPFETVRAWGALEWARPAIEITITGGVETVDYQMREIFRGEHRRDYFRFQTIVPDENRAMDDASERNLAAVRAMAEAMIEAQRDDLDALIADLLSPRHTD